MVDPTPQQQLEQELAQAKDRGRWLSDEELDQQQRDEQQALVEQQEQDQHRLKLAALAVVCRDTAVMACCLWLDSASPLSEDFSTFAMDRRWQCRSSGIDHAWDGVGYCNAFVDADSVSQFNSVVRSSMIWIRNLCDV